MVKPLRHPTSPADATPLFSERSVWRTVGAGWRHLHGNVRHLGVSFEWHDFTAPEEFDWGRSFHPESLEICLNFAGEARIGSAMPTVRLQPLMVGLYRRGETPLPASRVGGQQHQFLTVEMSFDFVRRHLGGGEAGLHPLVRQILDERTPDSAVAQPVRLTARQQQLLASLREAPVLAAAQSVWYAGKALEVAAEFFYQTPGQPELFCQRQHRLASERAERVMALLRANLAEPPGLEEIGRQVGCSPFHLSRIFSSATGLTIPQYLRQLRLERAAELLRSGRCNVTEAAMEVGYSSLSHFSQAFHEMYGCCPGLYPLHTPAQRRKNGEGW